MSQVAGALIVKDNKIILVQQLKESAKGLWSYPGGRLENGETIAQAVVREVQEELGVVLSDTKKFKDYNIVTSFGRLAIASFTGTIGNQQIVIKKDELMAYGWYSLNDLQNMSESLRSEIVLTQAIDVLRPQT